MGKHSVIFRHTNASLDHHRKRTEAVSLVSDRGRQHRPSTLKDLDVPTQISTAIPYFGVANLDASSSEIETRRGSSRQRRSPSAALPNYRHSARCRLTYSSRSAHSTPNPSDERAD